MSFGLLHLCLKFIEKVLSVGPLPAPENVSSAFEDIFRHLSLIEDEENDLNCRLVKIAIKCVEKSDVTLGVQGYLGDQKYSDVLLNIFSQVISKVYSLNVNYVQPLYDLNSNALGLTNLVFKRTTSFETFSPFCRVLTSMSLKAVQELWNDHAKDVSQVSMEFLSLFIFKLRRNRKSAITSNYQSMDTSCVQIIEEVLPIIIHLVVKEGMENIFTLDYDERDFESSELEHMLALTLGIILALCYELREHDIEYPGLFNKIIQIENSFIAPIMNSILCKLIEEVCKSKICTQSSLSNYRPSRVQSLNTVEVYWWLVCLWSRFDNEMTFRFISTSTSVDDGNAANLLFEFLTKLVSLLSQWKYVETSLKLCLLVIELSNSGKIILGNNAPNIEPMVHSYLQAMAADVFGKRLTDCEQGGYEGIRCQSLVTSSQSDCFTADTIKRMTISEPDLPFSDRCKWIFLNPNFPLNCTSGIHNCDSHINATFCCDNFCYLRFLLNKLHSNA